MHTLTTQIGACLLQRLTELDRVGVDVARQFAMAHGARFAAIQDRDAEFTVAFEQRPGDALERLERTVSDKEGVVEAKRAVNQACLSVW